MVYLTTCSLLISSTIAHCSNYSTVHQCNSRLSQPPTWVSHGSVLSSILLYAGDRSPTDYIRDIDLSSNWLQCNASKPARGAVLRPVSHFQFWDNHTTTVATYTYFQVKMAIKDNMNALLLMPHSVMAPYAFNFTFAFTNFWKKETITKWRHSDILWSLSEN